MIRESVPPRAREIKPSEPEVAVVCPALPPAFVFPLDRRLQFAGYSATAQGAGKPGAPAARGRAGRPGSSALAVRRRRGVSRARKANSYHLEDREADRAAELMLKHNRTTVERLFGRVAGSSGEADQRPPVTSQ